MNLDQIFQNALERPSGGERETFLDDACGSNQQLRTEVDALLQVHGQAGQLLKEPLFACQPTQDSPTIGERAHTTMGPYRLLEQIGEGAFGIVFMAEQREPVRRRVSVDFSITSRWKRRLRPFCTSVLIAKDAPRSARRSVRPERARALEPPGSWFDSLGPRQRAARSWSLRRPAAARRLGRCSSSGCTRSTRWPAPTAAG